MTLPLYGQLESWGSYTFASESSYISEWTLKRSRRYANLLGQAYPVDAMAGGVAPYESADITWIYWLVASDAQIAAGTAAQAVEEGFSSLVTLAESTGEIQMLTVQLQDGTTVTAQAALTDCTPRDSTREYSSMAWNIVFTILAPGFS